MRDKKTIEKIIEQKQKISDRNFMNYQETGARRYLLEHEKAEDIIDICRMALSIAEDRQMLGTLKACVAQWGSKAVTILHDGLDNVDVTGLLKDIKATAIVFGLTTDPWRE